MKDFNVDISNKILLSVDEAQALTGIGQNRIRSMVKKSDCPFVLRVGGHYLIKRKKFESFLEEETQI